MPRRIARLAVCAALLPLPAAPALEVQGHDRTIDPCVDLRAFSCEPAKTLAAESDRAEIW